MKTYYIIILLHNGNIMRTTIKADNCEYAEPGIVILSKNTWKNVVARFPANSVIITEEELVDNNEPKAHHKECNCKDCAIKNYSWYEYKCQCDKCISFNKSNENDLIK